MSSRIGLWLSSIRSVSPRVPTVEYARSERSSAKSSQAARNSALSVARSSGDRLRQAGSSLKNVNLTNVRSATIKRLVVGALAAGGLACGAAPILAAAQTVQDRTVTVAILPTQTTVDDLAQVNGMAVGLMSTEIGDVPPEQTYLDISQGNRVNDALYDRALPPLPAFGNWVPSWRQIVARANSAPADLFPGLLAGVL